ncbi:MAG TPA: hypothetical protein ENN47_07185 [Mesotoga infera]|uniref:Transposase n=1 Tax=Mesotoga infera TaxID=1236046 RepID=A0A7C1CWU7_9BACT|nr:hypothetical protein [Mesotoga infera]
MKEDRKVIDIGELEGDRRSTEDSPISKERNSIITEVKPRRKRRKISKEMKLRILKEIDESTKPGQIGAILRREGLYYSNISAWREQLTRNNLGKKLNEKALKQISDLQKENIKLNRELKHSKLIIEAQKKILAIIEENDES